MLHIGPEALRRIDAAGVERIVAAREAVIAEGEGELRGASAAALLFADYAVLRPSSSIAVDREVWAAVVWRLGGGAARKLLFSGTRKFDAEEAAAIGLCDEIGAFNLARRSAAALDAGAMLVARRGGDTLERAEFARLFAAGEPQEGLRAFLERKPPEFIAP